MRTRRTGHSASGASPWFARIQIGRRCELRPYSRAGWLLTAAYAFAMVALGLSLTAIEEPRPAVWISWAVVSLAMTLAFVLTAWRTSEPVEVRRSGLNKTSNSQLQSIILSLLAAAAIIGAAFFGFDI